MDKLIEQDDCIYDREQLMRSHGFEHLDSVGGESFVNHIHFDDPDHSSKAQEVIAVWTYEMKTKWPLDTFRIYVQHEVESTTIRFHRVRKGAANWYEDELEGVEILVVRA